MRIYVQTGGKLDTAIPEVYVMVDLILSGEPYGVVKAVARKLLKSITSRGVIWGSRQRPGIV